MGRHLQRRHCAHDKFVGFVERRWENGACSVCAALQMDCVYRLLMQ